MEFLTVKETAQLLRVSPITVRRYIASGQLAAERVGRGIRVRREAIEEFVTPVVPASKQWGDESEDLPTLREQLGNIIGIGRSGKPGNISEHKYEYLTEAYSDEDDDEEDELDQDELVTEPFTTDDPLWDIVGIGRSGGPNDVASNKHKYLADAIFADKFGKE